MIFEVNNTIFLVAQSDGEFCWNIASADGLVYQSTGPDEATAMIRLADQLTAMDPDW